MELNDEMKITDDEVGEVAGGARRVENLELKPNAKVSFGNTLYSGQTNQQGRELLYKESEHKDTHTSNLLDLYDEEDPNTLHGPLGS